MDNTTWGVSLYNAGLKTPAGYYRDHNGVVRPIFHSGGGVREPMSYLDDWKGSLTDDQRAAINEVWTGGGSESIRKIARNAHPDSISAVTGVAPADIYDYWKEKLSLTNEAVHTAPQAKGTIYRGIVGINNRAFDRIANAKTFVTKGPASFTTDPERVPIAHASGVNSVMFVAEHHNAGDIATLSAFPEEQEAIVPQGSVYRVVRKNVVRNHSGDGGFAQIVVALDDGKAPPPRGAVEMSVPEYEGPPKVSKESVDFESPAQGLDHCIQCEFFDSPHSCLRVEGRIHPADWCKLFSVNEAKMAEEPMSLTEDELVAMDYARQQNSLYSENDLVAVNTEPDSQLSHGIKMAGTPEGYFRDKQGRVRPIFTSPGGVREPMNEAAWYTGLSEDQRQAVKAWQESGYKGIRAVSGAPTFSYVPGDFDIESYKGLINDFNEAIHTAPGYSQEVQRGVRDLTDEAFDRITKAKTIVAKAPASFTTDPGGASQIPTEGGGEKDIILVSAKHNAGDISTLSDYPWEKEAVIPQGSKYRVVSRTLNTDDAGGKHGLVRIELAPDADDKKAVAMALGEGAKPPITNSFFDISYDKDKRFTGPKGESLATARSTTPGKETMTFKNGQQLVFIGPSGLPKAIGYSKIPISTEGSIDPNSTYGEAADAYKKAAQEYVSNPANSSSEFAGTPAPEGYFRDSRGVIHPIHQSSAANRKPAANAEEWAKGLTPAQKQSIAEWSGAAFIPIRKMAKGNYQYHDDKFAALMGTPPFFQNAADDFNHALDTAPQAQGTVHRIISGVSDGDFQRMVGDNNAWSPVGQPVHRGSPPQFIRSRTPNSFTTSDKFIKDSYGRTKKANVIIFHATKHNAADIRSLVGDQFKGEEEAVVPQGSLYHVDKVDVKDAPKRMGYGHVAHVYMSLANESDKKPWSEEAEFASEPTRFFTDKNGKRIPVFEGGENRHPMDTESWKKSLSPDQLHSINAWTGTGYGTIKEVSKRDREDYRYEDVGAEGVPRSILEDLHNFNTVVDTAPQATGKIFRGMYDVSDDRFDSLVNAASITSRSPVSFSRSEKFAKEFAGYPSGDAPYEPNMRRNSIMFVADKHNGADISSVSKPHSPEESQDWIFKGGPEEQEAVVPKGSTYRVVSTSVKTSPAGGRKAVVNVEWAPRAKESRVEMAAGRYFTDAQGKVHPLGPDENDWSNRAPSRNSASWYKKMTPRQLKAAADWMHNSTTMKSLMNGSWNPPIGSISEYERENPARFQEALHMAPAYKGEITRGIHNLTTEQFNNLVGSKTLKAKAPVSFDKSDVKRDVDLYNRFLGGTGSSVKFVATKHNAGDLSSLEDAWGVFGEQEVTVPSGSVYHVDKADVQDRPDSKNGGFATLHISWSPNDKTTPNNKASLAGLRPIDIVTKASPKGFYTDHEGAVHPIFTSPNGVREPKGNETYVGSDGQTYMRSEWKPTASQQEAIQAYGGSGFHAIDKAAHGREKSFLMPIDYEDAKQALSELNHAIHDAPGYDGPIYRGVPNLSNAAFDRITNAKSLRAEGPKSFTKLNVDEPLPSKDGAGNSVVGLLPGTDYDVRGDLRLDSVTFVAHKHNGADLSRRMPMPEEQEVLVPQGSIYRVVDKQVTPASTIRLFPNATEGWKKNATAQRGRHATVTIEWAPDLKTAKAKLAAVDGSPKGFFRDKSGEVHPIFQSPSRHPMRNATEWKGSLTLGEHQAIREWTDGSQAIKNAADWDEDAGGNVYKSWLNDFNHAVDRAPEYHGTIFRGIPLPTRGDHKGGDQEIDHAALDKILSAKTIRSRSPASFSADKDTADKFAQKTVPWSDSVTFVADNHNGGSIRSIAGGWKAKEKEVIIPQGSTYRVDRVEVADKPGYAYEEKGTGWKPPVGRHAYVYISHVPDRPAEEGDVKLAAGRYFTDANGKVHPLGSDEHDWSEREPSKTPRAWKHALGFDKPPSLESRTNLNAPEDPWAKWSNVFDRWKTGSAVLKDTIREDTHWISNPHYLEIVTSPERKKEAEALQQLVHLAPSYDKPIYRGVRGLSDEQFDRITKSTRIRAVAPSSFSKSMGVAKDFGFGPNSVIFVADKHNGGDVSSAVFGGMHTEKEVVVPTGSVYKVDRVEVSPLNDRKYDFPEHTAVVHISWEPKQKEADEKVELAAESQKFFTDPLGKVHPIAEGEEEWKASLTPGENAAMAHWANSQTGGHRIKLFERGEPTVGEANGGAKWPDVANNFQAAVHMAPAYKGAIQRGISSLKDEDFNRIISAKTLQAKTPVSFDKGNILNNDWLRQQYLSSTMPERHSVLFVTDKHNGGDISSLSPFGAKSGDEWRKTEHHVESEVVIPKDSVYHVDKVDIQPLYTKKTKDYYGDEKWDTGDAYRDTELDRHPEKNTGKLAIVHLSWDPKLKTGEVAMAAEQRFFTDRNGTIHPLGSDPHDWSKRAPSMNAGGWAGSLTNDQRDAVEHIWASSSMGIKNTIKEPPSPSPISTERAFADRRLALAEDFQEALHTAPAYDGQITRGVGAITDESFNRIVNAKTVKANSPTSFSKDDIRDKAALAERFLGGKNSVVFVADKGRHNAGDISLLSRFDDEKEVVVPTGSVYKVDKVDIGPSPYGGHYAPRVTAQGVREPERFATIHISLAPRKKTAAVELAATWDGKATKGSVGYFDQSTDRFQCHNCIHWLGNGVCEGVSGKINPQGWCGWYMLDRSAYMAAPKPGPRFYMKDGKVRPIFESPGGVREPNPGGAKAWKSGLTDDQKLAIMNWSTDSTDMKGIASGKYGATEDGGKRLDDFNQALHTAPTAEGHVFRGITVESPETLYRITHASKIRTYSPVSFTKDHDMATHWAGGVDPGILFEATSHNAGDISSQSDIPEEQEAVIPSGSVYHVDSVKKETINQATPDGQGGFTTEPKHLTHVKISLAKPEEIDDTTIELAAPTGYFKDSSGTVHPIFRSSGMRHPSATKTAWKRNLTPEQRQAVHTWKYAWENVKRASADKPLTNIHGAPESIGLPPTDPNNVDWELWGKTANHFQEAIDTAPAVNGAVYRGMSGLSDEQFASLIKAKALRSSSPVSFSSAQEAALGFTGSKNSVLFVADKHNAADISSITDVRGSDASDNNEHEAVIPGGSTYHIDKVEVGPHPWINPGRLATIHLSYKPNATAKGAVEMAAGTPTGFFKDAQGNTHPTFTSPGGQRSPMANNDEWAKSLSPDQKTALSEWGGVGGFGYGNGYSNMKSAASGAHRSTDPDTWEEIKQHVSNLNAALHTAPSYDGSIFRGMSVSKKVFDGLTHAKTLLSSSPVSFSKDDIGKKDELGVLGTGRTHSVLFRAKQHNGADISGMTPYSENEVTVPQGSRYKVNAVHTRTMPEGGKRATIDIQYAQDSKGNDIKLAADRPFFTDSGGKVHPLFTSPGGRRQPNPSAKAWSNSLSLEESATVRDWMIDQHLIKGVAKLGTEAEDPDLALIDKNEMLHELDSFNRAVHKAPDYTGPIYRGLSEVSDIKFDRLTHAKTLRSLTPVSFTKDSTMADTFAQPAYTMPNRNAVTFIASKHNGGDIESMALSNAGTAEHEVVVPQGSTYRVDKVEVTKTPTDEQMIGGERRDVVRGRSAKIYISHVPNSRLRTTVEMAEGSPAGFFRDSEGKTHPIFHTTGGVRHPMDKDAWLKSITPEEGAHIRMWTSDSEAFKAVARGNQYGDAKLNNDWKSALDTFNHVVDRAPTYQGDIYRGISGLSDHVFDKLTKAHVFQAKAPASFTGTREAGKNYANLDLSYRGDINKPNYNSILFVSKKGHHNGGHLHPFQVHQPGHYGNENEVVVPQGSAYGVDKVRVDTNPSGGRVARMYISHIPNYIPTPQTAEMAGMATPGAPEGFFKDESGKTHPIFTGGPGRHPEPDAKSWAAKMTPNETYALKEEWGRTNSFLFKAAANGDPHGNLTTDEARDRWKTRLNDLNTAIDKAPAYAKPIFRGVGSLRDDQFEALTHAKTLSALGPSSFTKTDLDKRMGTLPDSGVQLYGGSDTNSVMFVADKHNGADISSMMPYKEHEVIVPHGTAFHVTSVKVTPRSRLAGYPIEGEGAPISGKHAIIHLSQYSPDEKLPSLPKADEAQLARYNADMASPGAPQGYFRDEQGKIHPISTGGGGGGVSSVDRFGPQDTLANNPKPVINQKIRDIAQKYVASMGLRPVRNFTPQTLQPKEGRGIADAYEKAADNPRDPQTKAAYESLNKEISAQWDAISAGGIKMEPWEKRGQPYKNSTEMEADVSKNNHLFYFKTTGGKNNHPNSLMTNEQNDRFRAVHDVFGHAQMGNQFGPVGETNAYLEHSQMFTPQALHALTTETLGQNATYNFGKYNIGKPSSQRKFALQKATLLPKEAFAGLLHRRDTAFEQTSMAAPQGNGGADEDDVFACSAHRRHPDDEAALHPDDTETNLQTGVRQQIRTANDFHTALKRALGQDKPHGELSTTKAAYAATPAPAGQPEGQHFFTDSSGKVHPLGGKTSEERMKGFIEQGQNVWEDRVRGGAKNTLVTEIARRMSADPETAKAFEDAKKQPIGWGHNDTMYDQANTFVRGWAAMAGDNDNPLVVAHHLAVSKEFGLDSKPFTKNQDSIKQANNILSSNGGAYERLYRGYLRAEYGNTQDALKKAGIDHVTLNRGMTWDPHRAPEWVSKLPPRSASETPSTTPNGNDEPRARDMTLPLQPVTSWTANPKTNAPLGSASTGEGYYESTLGHNYFTNVSTTVPASRILSTARTGRGALPEYEVTVLGGPTKVHAVRMDHADRSSYGRNSTVYPNPLSDRALFASGEPSGYFKDKHGIVHPIIEDHSPKGIPAVAHEAEPTLIQKLKGLGGFSFHAQTGEQPEHGFVVSPYEGRTENFPGTDVSRSDLHNFIQKNKDLLTKPDHYVGGWHSKPTEENGHVDSTALDVSIVRQKAEDADRIGREHHQEAYYDIDNDKNVYIDYGDKSQHATEPQGFFRDSSGNVHPLMGGGGPGTGWDGGKWNASGTGKAINPYPTKIGMGPRAMSQAQEWLKGIGLSPQKLRNAFERSYSGATSKEVGSGKGWYGKMHTYGTALAKHGNMPLHSAMGTIAALSPHNEYIRNLKDAKVAIDTVNGRFQGRRLGKSFKGDRNKFLLKEPITNLTITPEQAAAQKARDLKSGSKELHSNPLDVTNYHGLEPEHWGKDFTGTHDVHELPGDVLAAFVPHMGGLRTNFARAMVIARGGDPDNVLKGNKVRSFYNNGLDPEGDPYNSSTIDTHIIQEGRGKGRGGYGTSWQPGVKSATQTADEKICGQVFASDAKYKLFDDAMKYVAAKHGVRSHQGPATVWNVNQDRAISSRGGAKGGDRLKMAATKPGQIDENPDAWTSDEYEQRSAEDKENQRQALLAFLHNRGETFESAHMGTSKFVAAASVGGQPQGYFRDKGGRVHPIYYRSTGGEQEAHIPSREKSVDDYKRFTVGEVTQYGPRLTPFDSDDIVKARHEQSQMQSTWKINTLQRDAFRDQLTRKTYGTGARLKNREAWVVMGPPGAGKSQLADKVREPYGAMIIDSDEVKKEIPEYQGGRFAGAVHQESSNIADRVLDKAVRNGDNVIYPIVGKHLGRAREITNAFKDNGYKVHLQLVSLPTDKAIGRAIERHQQTGRFVDPLYIEGVDARPDSAYAILKEEGSLDSYEAYSSDVPRGAPLRRLDGIKHSQARNGPAGGRPVGLSGRVPRGPDDIDATAFGEAAGGAPKGFFKDSHGVVHPIYEPGGQRNPAPDHATWMSSLDDEQVQALHDWTMGANNKWFKQTAKTRPDDALENGSYSQVDALQRALATAPEVKGSQDTKTEGGFTGIPTYSDTPRLIRGIHDLSDAAFNKIVNSKTMTATSPTSFTSGSYVQLQQWFDRNRNPTKNNVVFHTTDHNAADIHLAAAKRYQDEHEAVVPQGSRYHVDKVDMTPAIYPESGPEKDKRYKGARADVYLSLDRTTPPWKPDSKEKGVVSLSQEDKVEEKPVALAMLLAGPVEPLGGHHPVPPEGESSPRVTPEYGDPNRPPIYRAIHDLSDAAFDRLKRAKHLRVGNGTWTTHPEVAMGWYSRDRNNQHNSAVFRSDDHNGDVVDDHEVAVPSGSRYKVNSVRLMNQQPSLGQGQHAEIHISVDPEAEPNNYLMAKPPGNLSTKVHAYLVRNYPPASMTWVKHASWNKESIPVSKLHFESGEKLSHPFDDSQTKAMYEWIKAGHPIEPVVLLQRKDGTYTIVDGHHRARVYGMLHKPDIEAYVGVLPNHADPWERRSKHAALFAAAGITSPTETFARYERRFPVEPMVAQQAAMALDASGWGCQQYSCETAYLLGPSLRIRTYGNGTRYLESKHRDSDGFVLKERSLLNLPWDMRSDVCYNRLAFEKGENRVTIDGGLRRLDSGESYPNAIIEVKGELPRELSFLTPHEDSRFGKWRWIKASPRPLRASFSASDTPNIEMEAERKFAVHSDLLPTPDEYQDSRVILQGYWPGDTDDVSLRLIPSEGKAWLRRKTHVPGPKGSRFKMSQQVSYERAVSDIMKAPIVAVKKRDWYEAPDGRVWKVEKFDDGQIQTETEDAEGPTPIAFPPFVGEEHTFDPSYYTVSHARERTPMELSKLLTEKQALAAPSPWVEEIDRMAFAMIAEE